MKKHNFKILKRTFLKIKRFFIVFTVFLLMIILSSFWLVGKISSVKEKIAELENLSVVDIKDVSPETVKILSENAVVLSSFLPDEPNLYQIIKLIDQLASETRFVIHSYDLKHLEAKPDTLQKQSLKLVGSGTIEEFMMFLKQYKFITGKLLTVDDVNLTGSKRVLSNLSVNIYTFDPDIGVENESVRILDKTDIYILKQINKFYRSSSKKTDIKADYKSKEDPFSR